MRKIATSLPDFCFSNRAYSATIAIFSGKLQPARVCGTWHPRDVRARQSFVFRKERRTRIALPDSPAPGKLVRVVTGEVLDVALDLRRNSSTFGKWEAIKLSGRTNTSYGFHADLLTASGSCQRRPTSSIRQPISMRPSTNARGVERPGVEHRLARRRRRDCLGKRPDWCAFRAG